MLMVYAELLAIESVQYLKAKSELHVNVRSNSLLATDVSKHQESTALILNQGLKLQLCSLSFVFHKFFAEDSCTHYLRNYHDRQMSCSWLQKKITEGGSQKAEGRRRKRQGSQKSEARSRKPTGLL